MINHKLSSDEELVVLYKNGDERAFEELYERYARRLKRLIYYYVGDSETADDVFHDVCMRVIKHVDKFRTNMTFSSWIYQITVNCSKNFLKKKSKNERLLEKEKFRIRGDKREIRTPEDEIVDEFDVEIFNKAVDSLKDRFRDVFILRFDHRLKYVEIADILKCSERTAKWRMKKSIDKITQFLKENKAL